ncbi:hypothetical protein T4B_13130 [Trichinella pseudospiralis]|uniref:Uncharacterized protein n=1 Tax=Trichinella pseudospiralis TaxID=6337 RepID=A0A0V1H828_TRIPS|nr:hypothetical protein T4B_13130 [Trichinella pseudospiralis]
MRKKFALSRIKITRRPYSSFIFATHSSYVKSYGVVGRHDRRNSSKALGVNDAKRQLRIKLELITAKLHNPRVSSSFFRIENTMCTNKKSVSSHHLSRLCALLSRQRLLFIHLFHKLTRKFVTSSPVAIAPRPWLLRKLMHNKNRNNKRLLATIKRILSKYAFSKVYG